MSHYCGSNELGLASVLCRRQSTDRKTVQSFKSTYLSTDLVRVKKNIDARSKTAEVLFASISSETAFFDSNKKILEWIWNENPYDVHREIRNKAGVDDSYALCGEWLINSEEYRSWDESNGVQVFWLCGTGKHDSPPCLTRCC